MNDVSSSGPTPAISDISPSFAKALVKVQTNLEGAKKGRANPAFKSKYADLGACWDACSDALQEAEIAVLQFPCKADPGHVGLYTALVYGPTGEIIGDSFQLPLRDPTNAQAGGSAITYARRYALCSILGICPEDDDGNAANAPRKDGGNGGKAVQPAQTGEATVLRAGHQAVFDACTSLGERKDAYSKLRDAPDFTGKTELLAAWSAEIKKEIAK